jgi:CxxC motif-containing protein (DUF1111 family)
MEKKLWLRRGAYAVVAVIVGYFFFQQVYVYAPDEGQLGGPVKGLTPTQLRKFYATEETFKHEFTPEEGLGPLFNGRSCFECHGQPTTIGGEGRDVASTGVIRIGTRLPNKPMSKAPLKEVISNLTQEDVDILLMKGGPALERKSITSEFINKYPANCQIELATVPPGTELISMRHAPPLFGFGLIEAIPDPDIVDNVFKELKENPQLAGRALSQVDPLTYQPRVSRFGWKNQNSTLMTFTQEALNTEMGVTTFFQKNEKSAQGISQFPRCIYKFLPPEPNDIGKNMAKMTYFQALLAPPGRGPITAQVQRGEKVFSKLDCAVCHRPEMSTSPVVYVVDPDSPAPQFRYIEVPALESKPVRAYSDFLVHQMGPGLADGLPQGGAKGGEWRTTPLWGLRLKKFLLHDGRTSDISEAILAHGGQATMVAQNFKDLPESDKADLLAFLKSL